MDTITIRQQKRQLRKNFTVNEQQTASAHIVDNIIASSQFKRAQNVALFLPNDGEPDLSALITHAWAKGKNCYLPIVGQQFETRLRFQPYLPNSPMILNRYGIPEPKNNTNTRISKAWLLDLILIPLVAFDTKGNRIGMGGGFYDKTLYFRRYRHVWLKPPLMGVAYQEQQVPNINTEDWDVGLDFIVTDKEVISFEYQKLS